MKCPDCQFENPEEVLKKELIVDSILNNLTLVIIRIKIYHNS